MKRWLVCLFTYDRPLLLRNAVRSIDRFFPWGDRLLIDDGSSDRTALAELGRLASMERWKVTSRTRRAKRLYGGFYRNMRVALEYALAMGYDRCMFFEDDEQFVWRKESYLEEIERVFDSAPDCVQIQPLLMRRVISYHLEYEYIASVGAYRSNRGFNTTAIWNLDVVRRYPDYRFVAEHGDDLPLNSAYWLSRGYRVYLEYAPTVAIVPWVRSGSPVSQHARLAEVPAAVEARTTMVQSQDGELSLRPLNAAEVEYLTTRPPHVAAYQEYFDLGTDSAQLPIWHQAGRNLPRFHRKCREVVELEDRAGTSPPPIPMRVEWEPSTIPPLESHIGWRPPPVSPKSVWSTVRRTVTSVVPAVVRRGIRETPLAHPVDYVGYRRLKARLWRERASLSHLS